ncbi:glycosyltransferase family 4 protein [Phreatobacter aquaticus]|uniref:Glycosyltransferase family 4 protein n=1 Tax=Phreatobacter aquaticus TaxID=2570229 RepID=A0A4D7QGB8_9HYPH|nr:glycosyltransferase family 4 protein [Phreatobacter aquaticus]QCK84683.1 glycosyltransferase family 4 protein [Phreatobacter aquaticus]
MIEAVFAIPGDIATPTGGYRYDREVLARAPAHGVTFRHLQLPGSFPFPGKPDLLATAAALTALPAETVLVVDGLAFGACPESICASLKCRIIALVHHPLADETGLTPDQAAAFVASEKAALHHAAAVIVTSPATRRSLIQTYSVPADHIRVAEPGTERAERATGSGGAEPVILAVGAVSQRKGYDVLAEALAELRNLSWRAVIAGATDRAPEAYAAARAVIDRHGLGDRIRFAGSVSDAELAGLYRQADLFVMPSLYEGYGMVLAEAMARGLAIVTTTGGAAAETVPDGAALKVPPGDAPALAMAIRRALGDGELRRELRHASWTSGQALPAWDDTARIVAGVVRDVAARGSHRGAET